MRASIVIAALVSANTGAATAEELLRCRVEQKFDPSRVYSAADIAAAQASVEIILEGSPHKLRRCSFAQSANKVTCDEYVVDHLETTLSMGIRKFYYYRGQLDVQVFSDGFFVENNGRGTVSFGHCRAFSG